MDFNFTVAHIHEAAARSSGKGAAYVRIRFTRGVSAEMATISDDVLNWKAVFVWTPVVNEELSCRREEGNASDSYAVAFIKSGVIVGHMPHWIFNKDIAILIE